MEVVSCGNCKYADVDNDKLKCMITGKTVEPKGKCRYWSYAYEAMEEYGC